MAALAGGAWRLSLAARAVLVAASFLPGTVGAFEPAAQEKEFPEYVLKAGFLFNFAKYVEWPEGAFTGADAPYRIAVVGKDPFGDALEKTLKGRSIKGRGFAIDRFSGPDDLRKCHILFVPRGEMEQLKAILEKVAGWPVLLVGEDGEFCHAGGAISILIEAAKPKLYINLDAAERAKLAIDTKLLKAATLVKERR